MNANNNKRINKDKNNDNSNSKGKFMTIQDIEDEELVDEVPLEDLKIELKDEKKKTKTKGNSQSDWKKGDN